MLGVALLAVLMGQDTPGPQHRPEPVHQVDLGRYVGVWHEIAKIPNRFQRNCACCTTAEYALREDGRIDVINRCQKADGSFDEARGVARIEDPLSNARLKVSFVRFLGRNWFWGDYWVIGLSPGYEWAVVGHPDRRYGWILSRTPVLPDGARAEIDALLRRQGYDPTRFEDTPRD